MKDLFYRLIIYLDTASENDTYYAIALFMANHFNRIADMKIGELAQECYVSPATISRFCRALGYENYAHLKQECRRFHSNDKKFNNLIKVPVDLMNDDPGKATQTYIDQINSGLKQFMAYLDWNKVDQALALIHDSESVAFFGTQFSQSAALNFQTDLLMLEKYAMCYLDSSRQEECAKTLSEKSVAVIMTVNGFFANVNQKIFRYIKKSGCKVIIITSNPHLDLDIDIDLYILLGDDETRKTGKHNLLTLIELMSLRYYCLYYPSLMELKDKLI